MNTESIIKSKLQDSLAIDHLDVSNESNMHNVPQGSESHFRVVVVSDEFSNQPLLKRHRAVNAILKDELAGQIHALALHTYTSEEWRARGESAAQSPDCHGGSKR
ncbi:MAG: BolA/IbaG family iron-sulfur metabolism protein [Pseudomonadota bacterium]